MNNKRTVTSEEILEVYGNKDYDLIMHKASRPFSKILNADELRSCKDRAIWKSLAGFDPSRNTKYATYLYRGVFLECRSSASFVMKHRKKTVKYKNKVNEIRVFEVDNTGGEIALKESLTPQARLELMDEINSLEDGHILIDFYLIGLSYDEIAEKNSITVDEVKKKKNKVLKKLRKKIVLGV